MRKRLLLNQLESNKKKGLKSFAVLIDPDNVQPDQLPSFIEACLHSKVDYFFVGGSLITSYTGSLVINAIKARCSIPVVLFPGSNLHIDPQADAILFLSLISGRNPEFLIGQHVIAAPILHKTALEVLPTGYMLVDGGKATTVSYISNTNPIPRDKASIAACTALAGEMLGLRLLFLDAGSGASQPVPADMIRAVSQTIQTPLLVGGGIDSVWKASLALEAGADVIVVGNALEKNQELIAEISEKVQELNYTAAPSTDESAAV